MIVIKKSYRYGSEKKLIKFSTTFTTNLFKSTAIFPTPPVPEQTIMNATNAYEEAAKIYRAERSSFNAGETRNKRKELLALLNSQVVYVEAIASDVTSVEALGLEVAASKPGNAPLPGKPVGEGAKASELPQSVIVYCDVVKLANSTAKVSYYVYETNADGTVQLGLMTSGTTSRKLEFGDLTTGKVYYFYIRAKTTAGFGPPSKPIRWVGQ